MKVRARTPEEKSAAAKKAWETRRANLVSTPLPKRKRGRPRKNHMIEQVLPTKARKPTVQDNIHVIDIAYPTKITLVVNKKEGIMIFVDKKTVVKNK